MRAFLDRYKEPPNPNPVPNAAHAALLRPDVLPPAHPPGGPGGGGDGPTRLQAIWDNPALPLELRRAFYVLLMVQHKAPRLGDLYWIRRCHMHWTAERGATWVVLNSGLHKTIRKGAPPIYLWVHDHAVVPPRHYPGTTQAKQHIQV
eukprot:gene1735-2900_t